VETGYKPENKMLSAIANFVRKKVGLPAPATTAAAAAATPKLSP
jgi:hypothetical protein